MHNEKKPAPACLWWGPFFRRRLRSIEVVRAISALLPPAGSKIVEHFQRGISNCTPCLIVSVDFLSDHIGSKSSVWGDPYQCSAELLVEPHSVRK